MRERNKWVKNFPMKTREIYFKDYGISDDEVKKLRKRIKAGNYKDHATLVKAANEANNELARYIVPSLLLDLSYDKIDYMLSEDIPCSKSDFYAYQRLTLYIFKKLIE